MKRLILLSIVWALIFTMSPFYVVDDVQAVTIGDSCDAPKSSSQKSVKLLFSTKEAWDAEDGDIYCKIIDAKSTAITYEDLKPFFVALGVPQDVINGESMRNEGTNVELRCPVNPNTPNIYLGQENAYFDDDLEDVQITFNPILTEGECNYSLGAQVYKDVPIRYRLEIPAHSATPQTYYYIYFKSVTDGKDPAAPVAPVNCQCRMEADLFLSPVPEITNEESCLSAPVNPIGYNGPFVKLSDCVWGENKKIETPGQVYIPPSTLPTSAELSSKLNPLGTSSPQQLLGRIIKNVLGILGSIALVIFLYGGIMWMTSMGSSDKIQKSLSTLVWGALGVIVILASYSIVSFVLENIPK
jgi:hypothetical protein